MRQTVLGVSIGMLVPIVLVGSVMYFKWNADGPGTHGGGEDLDRMIEAPMGAPMQPPETARQQRQGARATVSGTVRDGDGAPIGGAQVCAAASSGLLGANEKRWPRCSRSEVDGYYRLGDLFGVRQRVSAGAIGYLPADHTHLVAGVRRRAIDLRPGGAAHDVDIVLEAGGVEVRGLVLDLNGRPIAGAWVTSGGVEQGNGVVAAQTDASGAYALWVRPGAVTVTAQAPGHVPGASSGRSEGHEFTVWLMPAAVLRGRAVRSDNREPVDGAWVRANPGGEAVKTDAAGHFEFDALAPGVYRPQVETDDGFGTAGAAVTLGLGEVAMPLQIAVLPAAFVEGRIVHRGGEVCDDGALTLRDGSRGLEVRDLTEPGGMVHVRGLLPGSYEASVTCTGALVADRYPRVVVRDRDVLDQVWVVDRGRSVAGVLRDADGAPVAGATLEARASEAGPAIATAMSDDLGRFLLRGLPAGNLEVVPVAHPRHTMPGAAVRVEVGAEDVEALAIALAATGVLRGRLRDTQRGPIVGAVVALQTGPGELQAVTGLDGGFVLEAARGRGEIRVSLGGAPLAVKGPRRVEVGTSTTVIDVTAVAPTGVITGVLVGRDGAPVVGALIEARLERAGNDAGRAGLWREGGEPVLLSDAEGKFRVAGLIAAPYTIVARPIGGGEARREHARPGQELRLDLVADAPRR